jgi:hypothetical protein
LVVWISLFFFASILGQSSHSISKWDLTNLGGGLWPPFYYRVAPLLFFATMALVETLYSIIIKSMLRDLQPKLHWSMCNFNWKKYVVLLELKAF